MGKYYGGPHEDLHEAVTDLMLTLFRLPDELEAIRDHVMRHAHQEIPKAKVTRARSCLKTIITTTDNKMQQLIRDLSNAGIALVDLNSDNQPNRFETKKIQLWVELYKKQKQILENSSSVLKFLPN